MLSPNRFVQARTDAENIIRFLDVNDHPVNLNLVLRLFKAQLNVVPLKNNVKAYNSKSLDGKWQINVNESLPYPEQRSVVVHEIFHLLNNEPLEDSRDPLEYFGEPKSIDEHAADQFADEILMPEKLFKEAWEQCKSIAEMAEMFFVPLNAIERRILVLGL
jgi:Zn-dependent peptidase ImmA (M78 family)